jgi:15-cis-phytoene synthase
MSTLLERPLTVDDAYRRCAEIVRIEAKNFAYGIMLLGRDQRRAMCAAYALARRIDDIGDGNDPSDAKYAALGHVRNDLARVVSTGTAPDDTDPVLVAIADAHRRFRFPLEAFDEIVDGCEADVSGRSYETFDELVEYCRLVAGSVGRISLGIFGSAGGNDATRRADTLGVALQVTNILRDIVEDRDEHGRIYLPAEDIDHFGCSADLRGPDDAVAALLVFEAGRARVYYDDGFGLLGMLDRRSRACCGAMAGIYFELLDRIERDPYVVMRGRVSLSGAEKLRVAARALAGRIP